MPCRSMNDIIWSKQFKRDIIREFRADKRIVGLIIPVIADLCRGMVLDKKYHDHQLTGNLRKYRDCHIKPDLVLLYSILEDGTVSLERIGSHAELCL